MIRLFLIIAGVILIGFLIINDSYNLSITTMGYEFSFSIALLIVALILFFYIIHLLKKPFKWFAGYRTRRMQKTFIKKENVLTKALTTVLDGNNEEAKEVLAKRKALFSKGSTEQLLFDALFAPRAAVFEQLKTNKSTELAGIRGLYMEAKNKGDVAEQSQLLETGLSKYPNVLWLLQDLLELQLMQDDWDGALVTLELLNVKKALGKAEYISKKSCILYKLGRLSEAFNWAPDNPIIAIAYAGENPKKAADILKKSWNLMPCWDTYLAFKALIQKENRTGQMKAVEKFVAKNANAKLSLLAVVDIAIDNNLWGVAKETLQVALNSYALTYQMAMMMATIERNGWHHEEAAKDWEEKAEYADRTPIWMCRNCNHATPEWDVKCSICNSCGEISYHM